jgi:hypothetical protein
MNVSSAGEGRLPRRAFGVALALLLLLGLAVRLNGLGVSFWMDEAWVANSLLEPTWAGLFYYPRWLQTTPPGFLALAWSGIAIFGHAPIAFRLVPLLSGLIGLGAVACLARRLAPPFALLAVLLIALSPTAIDYSRMLKQYSTELAVAGLLALAAWRYVERATTGRYAVLAATVGIGLTCAYSAVFAVGGVLVVTSPVLIRLRGDRPAARDVWRWFGLIAIAVGVLGLEYVAFYRPNASPELRRFWYTVSINRRDSDMFQTLFRHLIIFVRHVPVPAWLQAPAVGGIVGVLGAGTLLGLRDPARRGTTLTAVALGGLPVLAILGSGLLDLYPNFERTSLFVLPGLAVLIAWCAQVVVESLHALGQRTTAARPLAYAAAALCLAGGLVMLVHGTRQGLGPVAPREDFAAATRFVASEARAGDIVFVHACCDEGVRLYRTLEPWPSEPAMATGSTGQPCCRPGQPVVKHDPAAVADDIRRHVSPGFRGRVWIVSVDRADYWRYSSVAPEGPVLRAAIESSGCRPDGGRGFTALRVDRLDCGGR